MEIVKFGHYGSENELSWIVLHREENKELLITRYVIETLQYHNIYRNTRWEECSLRKWLNDEFLKDAFDPTERALICSEIFCLSVDEIERYLPTKESRLAYPTPHARENKVYIKKTTDTSPYWLRDSGSESQKEAVNVFETGKIDKDRRGTAVYDSKIGVRPAVWKRV